MKQRGQQSAEEFLEMKHFQLEEQDQATGMWRPFEGLPLILGRTAARDLLNQYKEKYPEKKFRILQEIEVASYRQRHKDLINLMASGIKGHAISIGSLPQEIQKDLLEAYAAITKNRARKEKLRLKAAG